MSNNNTTGGMSAATILTIIFVVLKLCKYIDWSWLWVLSPLWIPLAIAGVCYLIALVIVKISER